METAPLPTQPANNLPRKELLVSKVFYTVGFMFLTAAIVSFAVFFYLKTKPKSTKQPTVKTSTESAKQVNTASSHLGYVNAQSGLNLRESASADANVILILPNGTEVTVISTEGNWDFVEANTRGFVSKEFISPTKPAGTVILKTFKDAGSPFTFLYPDVYQVSFTNPNNTLSYSFTGNESYGGFSVQTEGPFTTLGNYALLHYNQKSAACDINFAATRKECEKVVAQTGTLYLVLVGNTLYKFSYLKTAGGLLADLNNLVFSSLVFK